MSSIDRAGLLRALAAVSVDKRQAMAELFDLVYRADKALPVEMPEESIKQDPVETGSAMPLSSAYLPPVYWVLSEVTPIVPTAPEISRLRPVMRDITEETWPETPPDVPCMATENWLALWDQLLSEAAPGRKIDLQASVEHLAKLQPIDRLPKRHSKVVARPVVIVFDVDLKLKPVFRLYKEALKQLVSHVGEDSLQVFQIQAENNLQMRKLQTKNGLVTGDTHATVVDVISVCKNSHVVVMGAFGALETGVPGKLWHSLLLNIDRHAQQLRLCALCPVYLPNFSIVPIEGDRQLQSDTSGLEFLLHVLSQCWLLDADLLWLIRQRHRGISVTDLLLLYNHKKLIERDPYLSLATAEIMHKRRSAEEYPFRDRVEDVVESLQPYLWRTERQAALLQQAMHSPECLSIDQIGWIESLAAHSTGKQTGRSALARAVISSLLPILKEYRGKSTDRQWRGLLNVAQSIAIEQGDALPLGAENLKGTKQIGTLVQRGVTLELGREPGNVGNELSISDQCYCSASEKIVTADWCTNNKIAELVDGDWRYHFLAMEKPVWASSTWRDQASLYATPDDNLLVSYEQASEKNRKGRWQLDLKWGQPWADAAGVDQYGLWADLKIANARLRLRWIAPGNFMMGDTGKQHHVTLSKGYWLGETTCTRAFWSAVEGNSGGEPGDDSELPMTEINWHDCAAFVEKLNVRWPALNARMPTEAEWEHACRAGTQTDFWWGDKFDNSFANNGDAPVAEADYPSNQWGLKSMSGNVWEWCSDRYGEYLAEAVIDPTGPNNGRERVLRGGGWFSDPSALRSAGRFASDPVERDRIFDRDFGFRLAGGRDPRAGRLISSADRALRSSDPIGDQD